MFFYIAASLGVAALFKKITFDAIGCMAVDLRKSLADRLMGLGNGQSWSQGFINMFDAFFGERHWSVRCVSRSFVVSSVFVLVIWGLMIGLGTVSTRNSLGQWNWIEALSFGIAINAVADYVSLLETRFLLGKLPKIRSSFAQALVLVLDLFITTTIIFVVIITVQWLGVFGTGYDDPLSIVLAFSIFTAPFYSTFLTSIWTWAYVLANWTLRLFIRLRVAKWLDIEHQPARILSYFLSFFVFIGAIGGSVLLTEANEGYTRLDSAVCSLFKGEVCNRVRQLAKTDEDRFLLRIYACQGGVTDECLLEAMNKYRLEYDKAAALAEAACTGGELMGCIGLSILYNEGLGVVADPTRSAELLSQACRGGEMQGCIFLASFYREGRGVPANIARAAELSNQACEAGLMQGCLNLGNDYLLGIGITVDSARATELYGQACKGGLFRGCANLGLLLHKVIDVPADTARAAELLDQACKSGVSFGCESLEGPSILGMIASDVHEVPAYEKVCRGGKWWGCSDEYEGRLFVGGVSAPADLKRSVEVLDTACADDDMQACNVLGVHLTESTDLIDNMARTVELFEKACEGGELMGCINLGSLHLNGLGVSIDSKRASELYGDACKGGALRGCTYLGNLYVEGAGVKADSGRAANIFDHACTGGEPLACSKLGILLSERGDSAKAADLFSQACEGGEMMGCTNLAILHLGSPGVETDSVRAAGFFDRACKGGELAACTHLGTLYYRGWGVPADPVRAAELFKQACENGNMQGCLALEQGH